MSDVSASAIEPAVGQALPVLTRTITLPSMIAYAGATWDWYRLHYDSEFIAAARLAGPVVDGQVFGALLVEQVQDWLGLDCFVSKIHFGFRNLVFADETVECRGTVREVGDGYVILDQEVVVLSPSGDVDRVAVAPAWSRAELGSADPRSGR